MPELQLEEFKYPDEKESVEDQIEIEIEDDTPPEDQNRKPLPKDIVEELEEDDLEAFTGEARQKLFQLKKVWNDERREKDAARKEAEEASRIAQQLLSENQKLKTKLSAGEQTLHSKYKENICHTIPLSLMLILITMITMLITNLFACCFVQVMRFKQEN